MPDSTLKYGGSVITLKVGGYEFSRFNNFRLNLVYNSIASTFSFDGFVDMNNPVHRKLFKPLSYQDCELTIDKRKVLTGTILNTSTGVTGTSQLAGISGYSKPGILNDCTIPADLQSDGLTFKQICEKVCKPFGINVLVTDSLYPDIDSTPSRADLTGNKENEKIQSTTAETAMSAYEYLSKLAKERNLILTHDVNGNLVITKLNSEKKSIATFTENKPSTSISLAVNGQGIHSDLKIEGQASLETDVAVESEIKNTLVSKYRPIRRTKQTGDNNQSTDTVEMMRGDELKAIGLTIVTPDWYWTDGKVLRVIIPNECIEVISPSNFLRKKSKWFVESVDIEGDETQTIATIKAVLPEVYTGKQPQSIFE